MKNVKLKKIRIDDADTFIKRAIGLIGQYSIPSGYAMRFKNCNSIHTFFMKIPIDVIMYDDKGAARAVFHGLKPWKLAGCPQAKHTVEMKSGMAARMKIEIGSRLAFK